MYKDKMKKKEYDRIYQITHKLEIKKQRHLAHIRYRNERLIKLRKNNKKRRLRDKQLCFERYGNKCACCGEMHLEFLGIDHIDGGGNKHRKELNGNSIYRWLVKNNFPNGYRVLCHNCNLSLGFYGYCPHKI